ncbi:MAG: hypothetical protein HYT48_01675 [Candidatus Vogelbacteria bacterium]|nr:hypothetical protein [Candidatus Vogelbacteria bacterium]
MKIFGFVAVRTYSSRLPGKMLATIRGKRVIEHDIERAKTIGGLDGLVVCTSLGKEDDVLEEIANKQGVFCFRGSLEDKLARFLGAADKFGADYFVNIDGDDPFCDPDLVEQAIRQIKAESCDVIKSPDGLVCGAFTFLISVAALRQVCEMKNTTDTEMYEVYFLENGRFNVKDLKVTEPIYFNDRVRLTLDYQEDLDFFKRVFDELEMDSNTLPLRQIMTLLKQKPEIATINFSRHKDYVAKRELMRKKTKIKN